MLADVLTWSASTADAQHLHPYDMQGFDVAPSLYPHDQTCLNLFWTYMQIYLQVPCPSVLKGSLQSCKVLCESASIATQIPDTGR